jgi:hypothetical protein
VPRGAPRLFDDLIGAREQHRRHIESQRVGSLQVDHQFELGRRLQRKIAGISALQDPVDVRCGAAEDLSNMARPGGNVTGSLNFEFSMGGKWLETLKQIAPAVKRAALLFNPDTAPFAGSFVRVIEDAAPSLGIEPIATVAHDDGELERNVADFAAKPAGGLIILPDSFTTGHRDLIVALAARYRLPAVYPLRVFAASGGLISDGVDPTDRGRADRRCSRTRLGRCLFPARARLPPAWSCQQ